MIVHEVGEGPPLVLVHGFGVDHRAVLPLDASVASAGWRRIYVDLPWVPPVTPDAPDSTQRIADALVTELRTHLGDEPFAILGNSFGGMLARHVAHELRPQMRGLATLVGAFVPHAADRILPERTILLEDGLALRAHYPRGTFAVVDAGGHNVQLERPALIGALLVDWLARMDA